MAKKKAHKPDRTRSIYKDLLKLSGADKPRKAPQTQKRTPQQEKRVKTSPKQGAEREIYRELQQLQRQDEKKRRQYEKALRQKYAYDIPEEPQRKAKRKQPEPEPQPEKIRFTAPDKQQTRKELHAASQRKYKLRQKLNETKDEKQRDKIRNKILRENAERESKAVRAGIKTRRSSLQVKAAKRSKTAKGIKASFDFRNVKDAKKLLIKFLEKGAQKVNGVSVSNLPEALDEFDNIYLQMTNYRSIEMNFEPSTGEIFLSTSEATDEDEENENENED